METAINSKLNPRDIDRAETDLLINLSNLTQRKLAYLIGCHESKISRTNWRFIASILCAFRIAGEISPIGRVVKELMNGLQKEKAQNALTFGA